MRWSRQKNPELFPPKKPPEIPSIESGMTPEGLGLAWKIIEEKDREIRRQLDEKRDSATRKIDGKARLDLKLLLAAAITAAGLLSATDKKPRQEPEQTQQAAERERAVFAFVRAAAERVTMLDDDNGVTQVDPASREAAVAEALRNGSGALRVTEKFGRSDYEESLRAAGLEDPFGSIAENAKLPPLPPTPKQLERALLLMQCASEGQRSLSFSFVDATGVWEVTALHQPQTSAPNWETVEQPRHRIIRSSGGMLELGQIDEYCLQVTQQTGLAIHYRPFHGPDRSRI